MKIKATLTVPGIQYPQGLEFMEGTPTGNAFRIVFQNLQFIRQKLESPKTTTISAGSAPVADANTIKLSTGCQLDLSMATPKMILLYGEETYILPANGKNESYFLFNMGKGKNQLTGTVNGVTSGYTLTAQYEYVEIQDVGEWIVVRSG